MSRAARWRGWLATVAALVLVVAGLPGAAQAADGVTVSG